MLKNFMTIKQHQLKKEMKRNERRVEVEIIAK